MKSIIYTYLFLFLVISCTRENKTEHQSDRSLGDIESFNADSNMTADESMARFNETSVIWWLKERKTSSDNLVTDIAAELKLSENKVDTIYFFTALGSWTEIKDPHSEIKEFPKDALITVYSESESAFFTVIAMTDDVYEVHYGGVENGKAYAVVWQGDIFIENDLVSYEIFLPEEVEVYTEYGTDL